MKKIIIFTVLSAFFLSGCKDFLSQTPKDKYTPQYAQDLLEILAKEAYYDDYSVYGTLYSECTDLMDDDVTCSLVETPRGYTAGDLNDLDPIRALYTWQANMFELYDRGNRNFSSAYRMYLEIYLHISACNVALDYIDKVSGPSSEKAQVIAESRSLRALSYFMLVNLFGAPYTYDKEALGVPLKLEAGFQEKKLVRNTVSEVYDQILTDLTEAEKAFEKMPAERRYVMSGRPNLPMVQMLRSRVCLYMGKWEESARYADYIIQNTTFSLKDLNTLDEAAANAGTIIGFRNMKNASVDDPKNTEAVWSFAYTRMEFLYGSKRLGLKYGADEGIGSDRTKARYHFVASPELVACYENDDLRKVFYLVKQTTTLDLPNEDYAPVAKFPIRDFTIQSNLQSPAYCFRLAEAYLNKAEALAMMGGREAEAREAINILRRKRIRTGSGAAIEMPADKIGQDLVDYVRTERRRELNFEGHRWFDLRRQGMPEIKHVWAERGVKLGTYTLNIADNGYTLPLTPDALYHNPALKQNPLAPVRVPTLPEAPVEP